MFWCGARQRDTMSEVCVGAEGDGWKLEMHYLEEKLRKLWIGVGGAAPVPASRLMRMAIDQRRMLRLFCFWLPISVAATGLGLTVRPAAPPWVSTRLVVVFAAVFIAMTVAMSMLVYRLQRAQSDLPSPRAVAYAVLVWLGWLSPLFGMLIVITTSLSISQHFKLRGIRVGWFGVPKSEFPKFLEAHCHGCGYDLRGLGGYVCPECGMDNHPLVRR